MSKKNKQALGRGLNSLLGGGNDPLGQSESSERESSSGASSIDLLSISLIDPNPDQPRREFDEDRLAELADSIKHIGLVQPITVQPKGDGRYLIISGERRYRASQLAGLDKLPVYVREADAETVLEMALVENIQREDLNAIEVALTYQRLIEQWGLTHEALADRVGKKRTSITNYLRLLRLPSKIQLGLSSRLLEMGHARALLTIDDLERQLELYQMILDEHLSVRQVEELARAIKEHVAEEPVKDPSRTSPKRPLQPQEYKVLEKHLGQVFGSAVSLRCTSAGKGRITIPFKSDEELERLIMLLERIQQ